MRGCNYFNKLDVFISNNYYTLHDLNLVFAFSCIRIAFYHILLQTFFSSDTPFDTPSTQQSNQQRLGSWLGERSAPLHTFSNDNADFSSKFSNSAFLNGSEVIDDSQLWKVLYRGVDFTGIVCCFRCHIVDASLLFCNQTVFKRMDRGKSGKSWNFMVGHYNNKINGKLITAVDKARIK